MSTTVNLTIHASQFPEQVQAALRASLRRRQVNHKFHYDSHKQTQQWLALHEAHSPARTDPGCAATYDAGFAAAVARLAAPRVHVIGLGCGGGQKDARLLRRFKDAGRDISYTPVDVGTAMVLVAGQTVTAVLGGPPGTALVGDLLTAEDLPEVFAQICPPTATRLITFFGMIPNFEPQVILPKLRQLLRPGDFLLFSANLAPGDDYAAGVRRILPQYDNALTTEWLLTFLLDLGVERTDGAVTWTVDPCPSGADLLRVTARFHFQRDRTLRVADEVFAFHAGDVMRLFFSYRYTPERARQWLKQHGLSVLTEAIAASGEEGVFLCGDNGG